MEDSRQRLLHLIAEEIDRDTEKDRHLLNQLMEEWKAKGTSTETQMNFSRDLRVLERRVQKNITRKHDKKISNFRDEQTTEDSSRGIEDFIQSVRRGINVPSRPERK